MLIICVYLFRGDKCDLSYLLVFPGTPSVVTCKYGCIFLTWMLIALPLQAKGLSRDSELNRDIGYFTSPSRSRIILSNVNDTQGHPVGDEVLQDSSQLF